MSFLVIEVLIRENNIAKQQNVSECFLGKISQFFISFITFIISFFFKFESCPFFATWRSQILIGQFRTLIRNAK